LKPALEPITVARKPLDGTVAENVLAHGTGALNVDGCRVGTETVMTIPRNDGQHGQSNALGLGWHGQVDASERSGRWPANLIHDGSEEVVGLFPDSKSGVAVRRNIGVSAKGMYSPGGKESDPKEDVGYGDSGSAARFFYQAKAAKADRDAGCEGLEKRMMDTDGDGRNQAGFNSEDRPPMLPRSNHHPTVKPTDLMRYLCRLVTPPGGVVLDPFTGSGSTGRGAILEGFRFIGIEREADYLAIARARIDDAVAMRARETAQLTLI